MMRDCRCWFLVLAEFVSCWCILCCFFTEGPAGVELLSSSLRNILIAIAPGIPAGVIGNGCSIALALVDLRLQQKHTCLSVHRHQIAFFEQVKFDPAFEGECVNGKAVLPEAQAEADAGNGRSVGL